MEVSMIPSRPALEPTPAVTGLLDLFAAHPVVALGEWHGSQDEADFVTALLHHPAFPATVRVIVVEIGNARYQAVVDRFIAGEPVAARDLRPVWRDLIGGFGFDAPIYEQFFRTVRAINRTLPPAQRLRVLLGDPPADWSQITQEADILPWLEQRDAHYAAVVEDNVLAPGHRGLLIAGEMHFVRDWPTMPSPPDGNDGNIVHRLERNHPRSVHVILPHVGLGHETSVVEPYLADWPIPSLISLHTTWLGELDAALLQEGAVFIPRPGSPPPPPMRQGVTLGTIADSYLYLGPRSSLTRSTANPAIYRGDELYLSELQRRHGAGSPFRVEDLLTEGDPHLFTD
jgi:hypothetical protein